VTSEGDFLILEEGLEWKAMALSLVDLQWIESQKLSRSDHLHVFRRAAVDDRRQ
jgi:phage portal protein BeeE